MNTTTRKQREFLAREQLFLSTARRIVREEGVPALTMERVAEYCEYSKGTLYKHFTCREDMLLALCVHSLSAMSGMFSDVLTLPGGSREKVTFLVFAYQLFARHFPEDFELLVESRHVEIMQKATPERAAERERFDQLLRALIAAQIQQAITLGDLTLKAGMTVDEVCFGAWAQSLGILLLSSNPHVMKHFDLPDASSVLFNQIQLLFDGLNWKPLSHEYDYSISLHQAEQFFSQFNQHRSQQE